MEVVAHAALGTHAPAHIPLRGVQVDRPGALVVIRVVLRTGRAAEIKRLNPSRRRGLTDHVDGAAQRVGAVEDTARAADDLYALGLTGVGGGEVAHAELVELLRDAVCQQHDAVAAQAAQHRLARLRARLDGRDAADVVAEQIAQGRAAAGLELLGAHHVHVLRGTERAAGPRGAGDGDTVGLQYARPERDVELSRLARL